MRMYVNTPELFEIVHKLYNKQARVLPSKEQLQEILEYLKCLEDLTRYHQFIPQLYLCAGQVAETDLDALIKQEIQSDTMKEQFLKAVLKWWRTSNEYLSADWKVWQDIFESCSANFIQPNPQTNVKFQAEYCVAIREKLTDCNRKLLMKSNCASLSTDKVLQTFIKNTLLVDANTLKEHVSEVVAVWKLGMCDVLVVKGYTEDIITLEDKLVNLPESKCLIVITDTHQTDWEFVTVNDTFCLSQLDSESQRQVLECQVDFQGYTVTLSSLADVPFLQSHLSAEVVVQLYNKLQVGQELLERNPCYLPRTFVRNELINEYIFKEEHLILAITGASEARLAHVVPPGEQVQRFNPDNFDLSANCRLWLIAGEADFTFLCAMISSIHWVEACEQGFRWRAVKRVTYQLVINHLRQDTTSYAGAKEIIDLPHQVVLVVAEPGMGKTTETTNIAHLVKQKDPSTWVVRVDLNLCITLLSQQVSAVEFLQEVATLNTEFEKCLLKNQLDSDGNVVIILDGFDEVSHNYYEQVFSLLHQLSVKKIKNIFVTSRAVMLEELQNRNSVFGFLISTFYI
ncbi:hypothetical protein L9F63_027908 [Diploptera punctata]|uniref:NACHT domain-containing protein n=1 Tax=Diploptera punctata TaxID=6984 RepID=A0AAD8A0Z9_DIPPU|nr:hypothetical protein L9F63_027908 [Diploptera punctata]